MLSTNQNTPERILRLILSAVLLPAPFVVGQSPYSMLAAGVGGVMLFNALSGACMIYKAFGVDTSAMREPE
jgi:hypothetical protein